jgi:predicted TIM-barrel fold metal-dependent hydrolase
MDDWRQAADRWDDECRRAGVERAVLLTGGGNDTLSQAVAAYPERFSGFAHHPIDDLDAAEQLSYAIDNQGLCGYKILAPVVAKPLSDRAYDDVFEVCHEKRLPVAIHFGILGGGSGHGIVSGPNLSPLALAETAQRFPHARFIVPHFGCGFTDDLLQLCWASPNVYVDTSGNNLWTKWTMGNYTLEQLFARFYATVGPGRIIFGSDSEWFPRGFAVRYLQDQLRAVRALNMPDCDIRRIFRENALELLDI